MERESTIRRVIVDPGTTIDQRRQAAIDMFRGLHCRDATEAELASLDERVQLDRDEARRGSKADQDSDH